MTEPFLTTADWHFDEGLIGFPTWRRFRFERMPELGPVAQLRSYDEPEVGFFVADPRPWFDDYVVEVPPFELEQLGVTDPTALEVYAIMNVEGEPFNVTVNLLGPLVVNPANGRARQIIQASRSYLAQQPITNEVEHARTEPAA